MELGYAEALQFSADNAYRRRTVIPLNKLETNSLELIWELRRSWGTRALEELRSEIRKLTAARHVIFAPSARCALAQVLSVLPQSEVVMPAFTCPVVKTAVEFARKKIRYVDIHKGNLNSTSKEFDSEALVGRILLPTHLFGIPTDVENICDLARVRGCITIEDAAAAVGIQRNGRSLGTFADIGIFSFERSKRFPAFRGAAIIINNDRVIDPEKLTGRPIVPVLKRFPAKEFAFAHLYNVSTQPWIYGRMVVPSLLQRYASGPSREREGNPRSSPSYQREFHPYQAGLVLRSLGRIHRIRAQIEWLVSEYENTLKDSGVQTFISKEVDRGGLLRFPIVVPGITRAEFLRQALRRGLYLETNYEQPLAPEDISQYVPNSLWAAKNMVLLPLYSGLKQSQARALVGEVARIAEDARTRVTSSEEGEYASHAG
jgi:dTDP-4-amino-4,6-dideoxygalactose transaminase